MSRREKFIIRGILAYTIESLVLQLCLMGSWSPLALTISVRDPCKYFEGFCVPRCYSLSIYCACTTRAEITRGRGNNEQDCTSTKQLYNRLNKLTV